MKQNNLFAKRYSLFFISLIPFSILSGYLLSKASLIGRTGINLFYKEYKFLKVWWQGALVAFIAWAVLAFFLSIIQHKTSKKQSHIIYIVILLLGAIGLYVTYYDFRHTLTHRLLGERFHLGGYLFWIVWMLISICFLWQQKPIPEKE